MTNAVRRAQPSDLDAGAAALASAFANDPIFNWLIPNDVERRGKVIFKGRMSDQLEKPSHLIDVADPEGEVRAAAVWFGEGDWKSADPPLREAVPMLWSLFSYRMIRAIRLGPIMNSAHPKEPHRYLAFIGVHQDHMGKGLGGALLKSMTEECDEVGLPAYLESSNPVNNALYHRFGFESRGLIALPKGAPPMMAMWRDPR